MDWTFWDMMLAMFVFFLWIVYIVIFVNIFIDIIRRNDLGGWAKAGWLLFLLFIPLVGALIYIVRRPKILARSSQEAGVVQEQAGRPTDYSPTDEIAKAQALKDSGAITDAEFEELKRKATL
jgi:Short C-terminal domain